jgi:outer membrane biosynthesis protein TonB
MSVANTNTLARYQQSMWGGFDRALKNCFIGSGILGIAFLITILVAPSPPDTQTTIEEMPERFARLILQQVKPVAPPIDIPELAKMDLPDVKPKAKDEPKPKAKPKQRRRTEKPKSDPKKGTEGRAKAKAEVTENLAQVTGSLDKALNNLSKSLSAPDKSSSTKAKSRRRGRKVRSGRNSEQLAAVGGGIDLNSADMVSSAIATDGIQIASITDLAVQDDNGSDAPKSAGASSGSQARSNESLLNAVRRYAPGIQFCYDNELKKNAGLRGKLIVSITVLANGSVSDVFVTENTLRSKAVTDCVLAQIRGWKLPEISYGVTTFKAPFVFTPPK